MKIWNWCKEKWQNATKAQRIIFVAVLIICALIGLASESNIKEGIATRDLNICDQNQNCTEYKTMDKIRVSQNKDGSFTVYNDGSSEIGKAGAKDVVFEGTKEYTKFKKDYDELQAMKKKLIEQAKKEELAKLEPQIKKAFYKIDFRQFDKDGNGIYDFYVNPVIWYSMAFDQKENVFKNCMLYVQLKTEAPNDSYAKAATKIKSASNAEVLAEYTTFGGIKVK